MKRLFHISVGIALFLFHLGGEANGEVITAAKPLKQSEPTEPGVVRSVSVVNKNSAETHPSSSDSTADREADHPIDAAPKTLATHYSNGQLESEREIRVTAPGEQENHGKFRLWDTDGGLVAVGNYKNGLPHGAWKRIHRGETASDLISQNQGSFKLPLISTFQFSDGTLDGEWKIVDASGANVRKRNFNRGRLHGEVVVYFSSGNRMLSAKYDQGVPVGTHREWTVDGNDVATHTFENGRLRDVASYHWSNGQLKAQGAVLQPRYRLQVEPNWWNGTLEIKASQPIGESHKVGDWSYFSEDGRTTQTAAYVRGEREGLFTWWYPNGQLQTRGTFIGGSPHGEWTWWHENGATKTSGHYYHGKQSGDWVQWDQNGTETGIAKHALHHDASPLDPPAETPLRKQIRRRSVDIPLTADQDTHRNLQLRPASKLR